MVLLRGAAEKKVKGSVPDNHNVYALSGKINRHREREGYYAAVDIGTTTLSIEVYNQNGDYIGGCAENNAQGKLGSDVMMRLMHASEGRQETLHKMIKDQIYQLLNQILIDAVDSKALSSADSCIGECNKDEMSEEHCENAGQVDERLSHLQQIAVVGNTVMCHLFLNKDTAGLRGTPFRADYQGSYRLYGKDLEWSFCPDVEVVVLSGIAAHVGADAAAVFMAEQLWQEDRIQLAIDLGTNAEVLLNCRGQVWVCSAAAGPAFEGKGITCGCRGGAGAVSGVKLNRANGNILLDVVPEPVSGKLLPRGICGSGLVDLIAELLENKLLQPDGYLLSQSEAEESGISHVLARRLEECSGERRFVLYDPAVDKTMGVGGSQIKCLSITQQDIRNFQLAKSAIQTGIAILCQKNGLDVLEIEDCRVAGVFGAFLHLDHAKASGLLPDIPANAIHFVGNAAGRGAAQALFDPDWIPDLEKKMQGIHHVELAEQENFQSLFLQNMSLCAWGDDNADV